MNKKKTNLLIATLILGIPAAATLISPTKSEAVLKGVTSGAIKTGNVLSKVNFKTPTTKPGSLINTKIKNLTTSSAVRPTTSSTVTPLPGSKVQNLIQGINKGLTGTSSSSSSSSGSSSGKLNLNSEFKTKLSGLLGAGNQNFASGKIKVKTQNSNVGKLSSEVTANLDSILGAKPSSTQSSTVKTEAYVNPNAPAAPSLTLTPTTKTPAPIPDAPPLPAPKTNVTPVLKTKTSATTSSSSLSSKKTMTKPQTTPSGYDNLLSELRNKFANKK